MRASGLGAGVLRGAGRRRRRLKVPQAFRGERVAIRQLDVDGHYGVFFASRRIATIDLTDPKPVSHVSELVSAMSPV
jgi:hypothetical protein